MLWSVVYPENRAVCEIMSKNTVEPEGTQRIWRMRVAYWISKLTRASTRQRSYERARKNTNVQYLLLFHGNSGFVNALQSYVTRTLPLLLQIVRVVEFTRPNWNIVVSLILSMHFVLRLQHARAVYQSTFCATQQRGMRVSFYYKRLAIAEECMECTSELHNFVVAGRRFVYCRYAWEEDSYVRQKPVCSARTRLIFM
jgi:hypothetical protein